MVEEELPAISVCRQCELMDLSPSSLYYCGKSENEENLICLKLIDAQYSKTPFYGYRKMRMMLRENGYWVNGKRMRRLMKKLGLITLYPKKKRGLSIADKQHRTYSYLLDDVTIDRPNRVLVYGYQLYQNRRKELLFDGGHGLAQPLCSFVGDTENDGRFIVRRGFE